MTVLITNAIFANENLSGWWTIKYLYNLLMFTYGFCAVVSRGIKVGSREAFLGILRIVTVTSLLTLTPYILIANEPNPIDTGDKYYKSVWTQSSTPGAYFYYDMAMSTFAIVTLGFFFY